MPLRYPSRSCPGRAVGRTQNTVSIYSVLETQPDVSLLSSLTGERHDGPLASEEAEVSGAGAEGGARTGR